MGVQTHFRKKKKKNQKAVIFWGFFITHFSTKAAPPNFPSFSEEPHQTPEEPHFRPKLLILSHALDTF